MTRAATNAYPLMRVQAHDGTGALLAEVDTVLPVASEADCQGCHLQATVCQFVSPGIPCGDVANTYEARYEADLHRRG